MPDFNPELIVTKGLLPENLPPVCTARDLWKSLSQKASAYAVTEQNGRRSLHLQR
jgi:hypothetical protein